MSKTNRPARKKGLIVPEHFAVRLGSNTFVNVPTLIAYGDKPIFSVNRRDSDGLLRIDFDLHDQRRRKVATIRGNHIVEEHRRTDYQFIREPDRYAVIEKATGLIICDIQQRYKAGDVELDVSAQTYLPSGELMIATPDGMRVGTRPDGSIGLTNMTVSNSPVGIRISPIETRPPAKP